MLKASSLASVCCQGHLMTVAAVLYVVMNLTLVNLRVTVLPFSLLYLPPPTPTFLFVPAADLPAPLPPAAGSAATAAQLQGQQVLPSQRQVSLTTPPPPSSTL